MTSTTDPRTRRWGDVRVGNVIEIKEERAKRIPAKNNRKGGERRVKRVSMTNDDWSVTQLPKLRMQFLSRQSPLVLLSPSQTVWVLLPTHVFSLPVRFVFFEIFFKVQSPFLRFKSGRADWRFFEIVFADWHRNHMTMGSVLNVYNINRDENPFNIPKRGSFDLFP